MTFGEAMMPGMIRGMIRRGRVAAAAVLVIVLPALALAGGVRPEVKRLHDLLRMPEMLHIMQEEGVAQAQNLALDWLPFPAGEGWSRLIGRIYDIDKMDTAMLRAFAGDLEGHDLAPLIAFFESDQGRRIVRLELEARQAFLDPGVEEAAHERLTDPDRDKARIARIDRYIEVNDLVEFNVMGALNSNYHFFLGLTESGDYEMTEEEMLAEVWSQEDQTRNDTFDWLRAFLLVAYDPLTDDDLDAWIELAATEDGQRLNRALFKGFEVMYDDIYHALGLAVAHQMSAEDL